jgi:hypothetical protein
MYDPSANINRNVNVDINTGINIDTSEQTSSSRDKMADATKSQLQLLQELMSRLDFDRQPIVIKGIESCSKGRLLVDFEIACKTMPLQLSIFPELMGKEFSILIDSIEHNTVYHAIMDALIEMSDRHVAENFKYRGYAAFSQSTDLETIGDYSIILRNPESLSQPHFTEHFRAINNGVDSTRAPTLKDEDFARKIFDDLESFGEIVGHLPNTKTSTR